MREILFRGYSKEDNQWHYGYVFNGLVGLNRKIIEYYYIVKKEERFVDFREPFKVDVNSIGQYTGFEDKNGEKIFEGDVLQWDIENYGYAEMINGRWMIMPEVLTLEEFYIDELANKVEIIGNVYEERLRKEK